jgi:hypothetical protein
MNRIWLFLLGAIRSDNPSPINPPLNPHVNKILEDETQQRLPSLTLAQYADSLAEVPLPTADQVENFVEYVAHAHSWYKHLRHNRPGNRFYFFLDKYAGWERSIMPDGTQTFKERTEQGFHYSDIPTEKYRTRFGHLSYSCNSGTTVFLAGPGPVVLPRDGVAAVPSHDAQMHGLPEEILEAGLPG